MPRALPFSLFKDYSIDMNKFLKTLPISFVLFTSFSMTSCGVDMEQYVGTWRIGVSYEETDKYYWGNTTNVDSHGVYGAQIGLTATIQKNKKVIYTYPNSNEEHDGKVGFIFGKLYFKDLPFSSDYKFELSTNSDNKKILEHRWSENKVGLEYTKKSRCITFVIVS